MPIYLAQRRQAWMTQVEADLRSAAIRMEQSLYLNDGEYSADALEGFRPTFGVVTVTTSLSGTSFCLTATSSQVGSRSWDSSVGGLLPIGSECTV